MQTLKYCTQFFYKNRFCSKKNYFRISAYGLAGFFFIFFSFIFWFKIIKGDFLSWDFLKFDLDLYKLPPIKHSRSDARVNIYCEHGIEFPMHCIIFQVSAHDDLTGPSADGSRDRVLSVLPMWHSYMLLSSLGK